MGAAPARPVGDRADRAFRGIDSLARHLCFIGAADRLVHEMAGQISLAHRRGGFDWRSLPDPKDKRASHVFLTEKARAMKPHFAALIQQSHRRARYPATRPSSGGFDWGSGRNVPGVRKVVPRSAAERAGGSDARVLKVDVVSR